MTIPSFPSEIILLILEAGYFNHKFRPDRYFLNNCSQISRIWAAQAQPLLFRHVEVRRPSSLAALKDALTIPNHRRPALQGVVLWLRIWIGFSESASTPAALPSLLAICPNLYGLSVTFRHMSKLPEELPMLPPNIFALECCDWEKNYGFEVARHLIRSGWHSLRILILRGHIPLQGIPPNLAELRVDAFSVYFNAIGWSSTVPRSQVNLRILDTTRFRGFVPFTGLLGVCNHSLESFRTTWIDPEDLKDCGRLRELVLETFFDRRCFMGLQMLPLEHLAYVLSPVHCEEDYAREYISSSRTLRVVSCLTPIHPWDQRITIYMDDLAQICVRTKVRLDCYTTIRSFREFTVRRRSTYCLRTLT